MAIVESPDELMAFADGEIVLEIDIKCAPGFLEDIGAGVALVRDEERGIRAAGIAVVPGTLKETAAEVHFREGSIRIRRNEGDREKSGDALTPGMEDALR
jgi:hypothetical protein